MADRFNVLDDYDNIVSLPVMPLMVTNANGSTLPGSSLGLFAAFDKAATEGAAFMFSTPGWESFDLYVEQYNFAAGAGNVRWSVDINNSGSPTGITVAIPAAGASATVSRIFTGATFNSVDVAGISRKGAFISVERLGGNAADTFDADVLVAALHAVRTG